MLRIVAETICARRQLTMSCAYPEGGGGRGPDPPWKITSSIGLYRDEQLDPPSWKKLDPLENVGPPSPLEYWKVVVNDSIL